MVPGRTVILKIIIYFIFLNIILILTFNFKNNYIFYIFGHENAFMNLKQERLLKIILMW